MQVHAPCTRQALSTKQGDARNPWTTHARFRCERSWTQHSYQIATSHCPDLFARCTHRDVGPLYDATRITTGVFESSALVITTTYVFCQSSYVIGAHSEALVSSNACCGVNDSIPSQLVAVEQCMNRFRISVIRCSSTPCSLAGPNCDIGTGNVAAKATLALDA